MTPTLSSRRQRVSPTSGAEYSLTLSSDNEARAEVEVIQADRAQAANLLTAQLVKQHGSFQSWMTACMAPVLIGSEDASAEIQAFARHRLSCTSHTVDREAIVRALYDAWPHTVISPALAEMTGLPTGTVLTFDTVREAGANIDGLYRYADAIIALLFAEPTAPEGYVLVPREPTEAMLSKGVAVCCAAHSVADAGRVWSAMLSANPLSPSKQSDGHGHD